MVLEILFYTFVVFSGIQIVYYSFFSSLLFLKKKKLIQRNIPISVIIFAKNNAKNLIKFLPSILSQNYPNFEVVLIDNNSTDRTKKVINSFAKKHSNIRIVNVENNEAFWGSKKYALTLGIKAAKHEHFLFTGANCEPVSENWIFEMSQQFSKEKTIILGYSNYKTKSTLTNFILRFYTFLTTVQYFNFTKLGMPLMADGRNLAYTKDDFYRARGFIYHMKTALGEDDLFIQDASNKHNTFPCVEKNSFIRIKNPNSFSNWFSQEKEKMLVRKKYQLKHRFFLKLFVISKTFFYIIGTILLFTISNQFTIPIILSYFLIQYIVIGISASKLDEKNLIYFLPFLDFSFLLIQISIFFANLTSKSSSWK